MESSDAQRTPTPSTRTEWNGRRHDWEGRRERGTMAEATPAIMHCTKHCPALHEWAALAPKHQQPKPQPHRGPEGAQRTKEMRMPRERRRKKRWEGGHKKMSPASAPQEVAGMQLEHPQKSGETCNTVEIQENAAQLQTNEKSAQSEGECCTSVQERAAQAARECSLHKSAGECAARAAGECCTSVQEGVAQGKQKALHERARERCMSCMRLGWKAPNSHTMQGPL